MRVVASCFPQVGSFQYGQLAQQGLPAAGGKTEAAGAKADGGARGQKGSGRRQHTEGPCTRLQ
jgi:hypothetical protein